MLARLESGNRGGRAVGAFAAKCMRVATAIVLAMGLMPLASYASADSSKPAVLHAGDGGSSLVAADVRASGLVTAATDPVRIWDFGEDIQRLNEVLAVGGSTGAVLGYKLSGVTEKSHAWRVDNPNICRIDESVGRISLTGLEEGATTLRLDVVTSDGKTQSDFVLVSVYTPVAAAQGTTSAKARATRSAHSGTDNKNERGWLPAGSSVSVYGKCGDYLRVSTDYDFADGSSSQSAFILADAVRVPVTGVSLDRSSLEMGKGQRVRLSTIVLPSVASDKRVSWASDNLDAVTVSDDGVLMAKDEGGARITASVGGHSASCDVTVAGEYEPVELKVAASNDVLEIGETGRIAASSGEVDSYVSRNENVAVVSRDGTVEAISPGTAVIAAKSLYGDETTCKITVKLPNAPTVSLKKAKKGKGYLLSWGRAAGAMGYEVYQRKPKKSKYKRLTTIDSPKGQEVEVSKGKYKVRSYAKNRKGEKFYSAFAVAKKGKKTTAKYKVAFVGNGASGKSYSQTVNFNKKTRLQANKFDRPGYAFVGWSTSKNGDVVYKDQARVKKLTNKKKIKLYAIWRSDDDPNGKVQRKAALFADTKNESLGGAFARDIEQLKKVYESANFDGGKIEVEKCPDKSSGQVEKELEKIGRHTTANDVTYLHFSCHGCSDGDLAIICSEDGSRSSSYVSGSELREWLDDYIDGKVIITLVSCYSGKSLDVIVGSNTGRKSASLSALGMESFVKKFQESGSGKVALEKGGKYKILTSTGDGVGLGWPDGLLDAVYYWSKGLGFDYYRGSSSKYADLAGTDDSGNKCYGNGDGVITLSELYAYAREPIHNTIVDYGKTHAIKVTYPRVYPENDDFEFYKW